MVPVTVKYQPGAGDGSTRASHGTDFPLGLSIVVSDVLSFLLHQESEGPSLKSKASKPNDRSRFFFAARTRRPACAAKSHSLRGWRERGEGGGEREERERWRERRETERQRDRERER